MNNVSIKYNSIDDFLDSLLMNELTDYNDDKFCREFLGLVVEDILKNENCELKDIEFIDHGFYSNVFKIGSKVVKLSSDRKTEKFIDNPYIIRPIMRRKISGKNGFTLFVEVTEHVNTKTTISDNEIYELYKNIRNCGLVWTDTKKENIGRLIKDNIVHWNESINPDSNNLSLISGNNKDIVLKKGDLVLLDADFIYSEEELKNQLLLLDDLYNENDIRNGYFYTGWHKFELAFHRDLKNTLEKVKNIDINSKEFEEIADQYAFNADYLRNIIINNNNNKNRTK